MMIRTFEAMKGNMINSSRTPETGDELESITDKIKEGIQSGKYTLDELQSALVERTKEAARTTDRYVHENPWTVIGLAAGVGLVLGLLLHRDR
jgi:ElaB/YqjD/DUF883 family membrane-anchored ribosome-binding protein